MKAIAFFPSPSPSSAKPDTKIQAVQAKDKNVFAPALSKAVENRKNANSRKTPPFTSKKPSSRTTEAQTRKTFQDTERTSSSTTANNSNVATNVSSKDLNVSEERTKNTRIADNGEITKDQESQDTAKTDSKYKAFDKFATVLLGYLFNPQQHTSSFDLQEKAKSLSQTFGIAKQESLSLLSAIKSLKESTSSPSQILEKLLQDPGQNATLDKIFQSLVSTPPNVLTQSGDKGILKDMVQLNSTPGFNLADPQTADKISQILQKIQQTVAANNEQRPVVIQLHPQHQTQNKPVDLSTLSSPVLNYTAKETAQGSDISTAPLQAATIKNQVAGTEKVDDHRLSKLDELKNRPFFIKAEESAQKNGSKSDGKDSGLQNTDGHHQNPLLSVQSETNTALNNVQQFSFGSTLSQTLQPTGHTFGTASQAHFTPWTATQENAIINQVMQRFHVNINSPSSRISVKLYPEELGELKIDVQMKDGTIKANIVTQTQQVQQVLEKFIPKLRTFMEQQGLTVGDILVTNSSDTVGGHNLFQEDFANSHDFSPPGKTINQTTLSDITFDKAFSEKSDVISGVNVTI